MCECFIYGNSTFSKSFKNNKEALVKFRPDVPTVLPIKIQPSPSKNPLIKWDYNSLSILGNLIVFVLLGVHPCLIKSLHIFLLLIVKI